MVTAEKTDLKNDILRCLKHGKENAIKKELLARLCNVNERQMRQAIRELTDAGAPICGSPRPPYGYYIAGTPEELKAEMALIRNGYGMQLLRRYSSLKKCLRDMEASMAVVDKQGRLL